MSKGFGSRSSKKKKNVKQLYLDNQFAEGKKHYLVKNYSKAELIFLNLKDLGYEDPNLFLYLANIYIFNGCEEKALIFLKRVLESLITKYSCLSLFVYFASIMKSTWKVRNPRAIMTSYV